MRRFSVILGLMTGALTLSCSGDGSNLAPSDAPRINAATAATCGTLSTSQYNAIITQLGKLYPTTSKTYTGLVGKVNDIKTKLSQGKVADAQQKVFDILKVVFADWTAGKLKAGATTADVQQLINLLYAATCMSPVPTLASGGGAGVITPAGGGTVLTSDLQAGTRFPAGAVDVNTVVTIAPTTDTLKTMLDKYPPTYDFTATPHNPADAFLKDVLVGFCFDPSVAPSGIVDRLRIAHNIVDEYVTPDRFGQIEILKKTDVSNLGLACTTVGSASFLNALKSYAASLLLPDQLHASSALLTTTSGGTTRNYSPFAMVDPQIQLGKVTATDNQTATAGTAVTISATAQTRLGRNVPGVPILFATSTGTFTPTPDTVRTNTSGVASASWTLASGANTATATGLNVPCDTLGSCTTQGESRRLTYNPASVSFSAIGTAASKTIDYGATDWKYINIGANAPSESTTDYPAGSWYTPLFPATAWSTGRAPFGSIDPLSTSGCGIFGTATVPLTNWPAASGSQAVASTGSGLLLRNTFTASPTSSVDVSVAMDNDIQVFIDGNDITDAEDVTFDRNTNSEGGSWSSLAINQFQAHGGCAQRGDGVFHVPSVYLAEGNTHTIAVYAHDWGGAAYVDVKVTEISQIN